MSRFLSERFQTISPYVPGEQPLDARYIKLNTNENPYGPSPRSMKIMQESDICMHLYPDPDIKELRQTIASHCNVDPQCVFVGNGSDEVLAFAFQAFHDTEKGICFPDITYGFYKVFAALYQIPYEEIPLGEDFGVNPADYRACEKNIILANPNAPTGLCLSPTEIEAILQTNKERLVIIDEAYIDFGGQSCLPLLDKYDNLLIVRTFSKSRSLAGARIGFAVANKEIIADLNKIKFSFNPYNINRLSAMLAMASIEDESYFKQCIHAIVKTRAKTAKELAGSGFQVLPSKANFLFVRHAEIKGEAYFAALRARGILVRRWNDARIKDFVRITIGTEEEMEALCRATEQIRENFQAGRSLLCV